MPDKHLNTICVDSLILNYGSQAHISHMDRHSPRHSRHSKHSVRKFRHSKEKMKQSLSRLPSPASVHASALVTCGGGVPSITLFEFIFCQYSCWKGRSRENHENLPPSYHCKRLSIRFGVPRNLTLKIYRQGSNHSTGFCIVSFDFN